MNTSIRVIPCLDVKDGRVVKGVNFANIVDAGDPVEFATRYIEQGADELAMLDISASAQGRATTRDVAEKVAAVVTVPFTIGGGIRSVADAEILLALGATRVSINTAAIERPELIDELADRFGSEALVLSVDARREADQPSGYGVTVKGGSTSAGIDALAWAKEGVERGIGEVMLNSMDADGTTAGFDIEMLTDLRAAIDAPIIASGGAGSAQDFVEAARTGANAILGASVFHFDTLTVADAKAALSEAGFSVSR